MLLENLSSSPPFASVWGLMKDILFDLEPRFPGSLMNTNTYSPSVIKNLGQDIHDSRREEDWLVPGRQVI